MAKKTRPKHRELHTEEARHFGVALSAVRQISSTAKSGRYRSLFMICSCDAFPWRGLLWGGPRGMSARANR
jgi:hypothetical protein